jgi:hypothetical protein
VSSGFQFIADHGDDVDPVAVFRRIDGDRSIELTQREREAAIWELMHRGVPVYAIGPIIGYSHQMVWRYRRHMGLGGGDPEPTGGEAGDDSGGVGGPGGV